jgi:hypothetical protein
MSREKYFDLGDNNKLDMVTDPSDWWLKFCRGEKLGPSPVVHRFSTAITETSGGVLATLLGLGKSEVVDCS